MTRTILMVLTLLLLPAAASGQRITDPAPDSTRVPNAPTRIDSGEPSVRAHIFWGAAIGALGGLGLGASLDGDQSAPADSDDFWNYGSSHYYAINGSIIGAMSGAAAGALVFWIRSF